MRRLSSYPKVDHATRVGCLARVRRKFFEAAKYNPAAKIPLKLLNSMFYWEKQWREQPVDRPKKRTTILKPLLDQFWKVVSTCAALPKSCC